MIDLLDGNAKLSLPAAINVRPPEAQTVRGASCSGFSSWLSLLWLILISLKHFLWSIFVYNTSQPET